MTILDGLDDRRKALGMSIPVLARRARLGVATVRRALRGSQGVRLSTVLSLGAVLDIEIRAAARFSAATARRRQAARKARQMVGLALGNSAMEGDFIRPSEAVLRRVERAEQKAFLSGSNLRLWS